jgi:hypothetical protein
MTSYAAAGSEFDVNSTFARTQAHADGAQLTDGRSIVTWVDADFNTTAGRFIRAQLYDADGTPIATELHSCPDRHSSTRPWRASPAAVSS